MDASEISKSIESIGSRDSMIRYLDGYASDRLDELSTSKTKRPLVKTYMLEHVGNSGNQKSIHEVFNKIGITTQQIDDGLFKLCDKRSRYGYMGFIETINPRFFFLYTMHHSQLVDSWTINAVQESSDLDHIWLSGITFEGLWQELFKSSPPNRYTRINTYHESFYATDEDNDAVEDRDDSHFSEQGSAKSSMDKRVSQFQFKDKVVVARTTLATLQEAYKPLYAVNQIRVPALGRGGHDFYDYGKVTNRSSDFIGHRNVVLYIQRIYETLVDETEELAWFSATERQEGRETIGAPVWIFFNERLSEETFNNWITLTFNHLKNRFRLWGKPISMGNTKVQVYGVDQHLWKPIDLEFTDEYLMAIIPYGTCGNTVHRLVRNIQRYIAPNPHVYIGDINMTDIVEKAINKTSENAKG